MFQCKLNEEFACTGFTLFLSRQPRTNGLESKLIFLGGISWDESWLDRTDELSEPGVLYNSKTHVNVLHVDIRKMRRKSVPSRRY